MDNTWDFDAEGLEVVEALGDAGAVAVGVLEAARVDLVEDRVVIPGGLLLALRE